VAILARFVGKRLVDDGFKKPGIRRGVRVVAFAAIHQLRINAEMGRLKRICLVVMAFAAQGLNRLDHQSRLGREMRFMANITVF
jgi:hypothetical protein